MPVRHVRRSGAMLTACPTLMLRPEHALDPGVAQGPWAAHADGNTSRAVALGLALDAAMRSRDGDGWMDN